jgi:hypothetical protein
MILLTHGYFLEDDDLKEQEIMRPYVPLGILYISTFLESNSISNEVFDARTFIRLGYPGEKGSDIRETIRHLKTSDPSFYSITVAYPITGTPLYNEVSNSLISESSSWAGGTDRQYDFKREHSKQFYRYAVNWVYNEVNYNKTKRYG